MSDRGLTWYKRDPQRFLDGVQGLGPDVIGAYAVMLDLIYARGGETRRDDRHLSGILGCSVRKATALTEALIAADKLQFHDGFVTNSRAKREAKSTRNLSETRANAGRKGGENGTGDSKNRHLAQANEQANASIEKRREEKISKKETNVSQKGTRLSSDWMLPREWGEWALSEGFSETFIRSQADIFKDYWIGLSGQRGVKADWFATWRNWLRRNQDKAPPKTKETGAEHARRIAELATRGMDFGPGQGDVVPLLPAGQPARRG